MTYSTTSKVDSVSLGKTDLLDFECAAQRKKIPIRGSIELLFGCNLKCIHCYIPEELKKSLGELSFEEICRVLDEIFESGCIWLQLTGGEPLLRHDFLDIYRYAKSKGFLISIFTNGTLITPKFINCLKELPPYCVEISLHSLTKKTYESITRHPGSFQKCIQGINMLVDAGIPVKIKTILMIANKEEIVDMAEYAHRLGVEYQVFSGIIPKLDGSKDPCLLRVSPEDVTNLINIINTNSGKQICNSKYDNNTTNNTYLPCNAGVSSFHIDAAGNLTPCVIIRTFTYDLRLGSFQEGWRKLVDYRSSLNLKNMGTNKYDEIESHLVCGHCPGWAYLEHAALNAPIEYLHSLIKLQQSCEL